MPQEVTSEEVRAALRNVSDQVKVGLEPVKQLRQETDELRAEFRDFERNQAVSRPGSGGSSREPMLASLVSEDEGFKMLATGRIKATTIKLPKNAVHGPHAALTTTGIPSVDRSAGLALPAMRRLTVRDLLTVADTDSGSVEYLRETAFNNAAAVVDEGALKPETTLTLEAVTAKVVTIAHWLSATKQVLQDNQQLEIFLRLRLGYGLRLSEEAQLLYGTGIGIYFQGLAVGATPYVAPFVYATPTKLDTLRLAIDQLEVANYNATGVVLHPDDMAAIELLKDTTGAYLRSDPQVSNVRTIWGRPAVVTTAMVAGEFLVGDFQTAATLYDREHPTLDIGWTADQFVRNLVTFRMEERISLALQLPGALVKGSFDAP